MNSPRESTASLPLKWALVTGGAAGIGRALCEVLAAGGYSLVIVDVQADRAREAAVETQRRHRVQALALPADLTDPCAPESIHAWLQERSIAVSFLANNAGFSDLGRFDKIPWPQQFAIIQILALAPAHLMRLIVPGMLARGGGHVLNVSSIAGFYPGTPLGPFYGASKAFLRCLTEALAIEYEGQAISFTVSCPGFTRTEIHQRARVTQEIAKSLPRWIMMEPEQVAREAVAAALRGQRLIVHGWATRADEFFERYAPRFLRLRKAAAIRNVSLQVLDEESPKAPC